VQALDSDMGRPDIARQPRAQLFDAAILPAFNSSRSKRLHGE
jgi:hypothetical protein